MKEILKIESFYTFPDLLSESFFRNSLKRTAKLVHFGKH